MEAGRSEKIEQHHFTPFASLLYQLPAGIRQVFGGFDTHWYWAHNPRKSALDLDIYWIKGHEPRRTARRLTSVTFDHTAYSYEQIVNLLSTKKVHNTSTLENV